MMHDPISQAELAAILEVALALASQEEWVGPIPALEGQSVKLGLLLQRLKLRVPQFWQDSPEALAGLLARDHPGLAADIAGYDPRALGFVIRMHRFLSEG
jgi:hypothetical protein